MQRAKPGNSSARFSPASKPANDAAEGYQIDVLRVTTLLILAGAQMRMSGPLHFFWSSGVTWRSRARHVGRAQTVGPERTRAFGTAGQVNEGRTSCLGEPFAQKLRG